MEHKTYPNSDRVGRCEFAVKTILGLALLVPCLVMTPREGTSLWYKAAALIIVPFALYMSILWMFLIIDLPVCFIIALVKAFNDREKRDGKG